jgi:hypothetical protein
MMAAFGPVTVMNARQPFPLEAVVPQAAFPGTW